MYAVTLPLSGPLALPAAEGGESGDFWSSAYPILPHPVELIFGLVTFGILYWIGVAAVASLLVYEHALVRPGDLRRLDAAFFTMNGAISVAFAAFVIADALT